MTMRLGLALIVGLAPFACSDDMGSNDPADAVFAIQTDTASEGDVSSTDTPSEDASVGGDTGGADAVTWHGQIRAISERHCASCHLPGGVGPFDMTSYDAAKPWAAAIGLAVDSGRMPPFYAETETCRPYEGQNVVSAADQALIAEWVAAGAPEGDESAYVAPQLPEEPDLGTPDFALAPPGKYTPDGTIPDDMRCFPVGEPFAKTVYASTVRVRPDYEPVVHHVIVYKVPASAVDQVKELDEAAPGIGYPCFGGPEVPAENISGWVPGGGLGQTIPEAATELEAGSQLVLQLHYNTVYADPAPDATGVDIWLSKGDPKWLLRVRGLAHTGLVVEPGNANSVEEKSFTNPLGDTTIVSVAAHMHLLATKIELTAPGLPEGDQADTCLLDIPTWDYHWQRSYVFEGFEPVVIPKGQALRMRCTYDNSAAHQPVLDGVQGEPGTVRWGEGTLDEMCLVFLTLLEPFEPAVVETGDCAGFDGCYETCSESGIGMARCIVQCAGAPACRQCLVPAALECYSKGGCDSEVEAVTSCAKTCGGKASCYVSDCMSVLNELSACVAPKAGTCGEACGATIP